MIRFLLYPSGLPQVMDGDLHAPGQRGHVERPVGELGQAVPGAAILPPRLDAVDVVARRVPNPQERAPLRPGRRPPDQAAVILAGAGAGAGGRPELCHERMTCVHIGLGKVGTEKKYLL